jgi:hypothetical protein
MSQLDYQTSSQFARLTLGHLTREYPHKLDHVMAGPHDVAVPSALHPVFHGSFDWHSCVHGWWQVMRLARHFPEMPEAAQIRALADHMLVPARVAGELAYLDRPASAGFERPYGWAWLLALHDELSQHRDTPWAGALEPLARFFAARLADYLPKMTYPIRVGTHFNTSFALILAHGWAEQHDRVLHSEIGSCAYHWFGEDSDCQAWEPGGDDFLSPALTEALLMCRVLPHRDFSDWLADFLPHLAHKRPATLFYPAIVSDRSDGKIAHLDGLNLSRAWCWRSIARTLGNSHPLSASMKATAEQHLHASFPHIADSYMGEHRLATFALLALEA